MSSVAASYETWVSPNRQLFGLCDPTCEEVPNFDAAIRQAIAETVGWGTNAMTVNIVSDLVRIAVEVEAWDGPPPAEPARDERARDEPARDEPARDERARDERARDEPARDEPELVRQGRLEFPGGQVRLPESLDDRFLLGVDLPAGPGTYEVRVCGYGRTLARERWQHAIDSADRAEAFDSAVDALRGLEHYRFQMWQIAPEPRWDDEDDDDGR